MLLCACFSCSFVQFYSRFQSGRAPCVLLCVLFAFVLFRMFCFDCSRESVKCARCECNLLDGVVDDLIALKGILYY